MGGCRIGVIIMVEIDPNGWSALGVCPEKDLREFSAAQHFLCVERALLSIRDARLGPLSIVPRYLAQASWYHVVLGAVVSRGPNVPVLLGSYIRQFTVLNPARSDDHTDK